MRYAAMWLQKYYSDNRVVKTKEFNSEAFYIIFDFVSVLAGWCWTSTSFRRQKKKQKWPRVKKRKKLSSLFQAGRGCYAS